MARNGTGSCKPRLRRQPLKALICRFPTLALRSRQKLLHRERSADDRARLFNRLDGAGAHRLHQNVSGRGRFSRPGDHAPSRGIGDKLVLAAEIIEVQSVHYLSWLKSLDANAVIRALRSRTEIARDTAVAKALASLQAGRNPEEVTRALAHALTNRFLHEPSLKLREAASLGHSQTIATAEKIFGLE